MFVTVFSSIQAVPACQLFRINHPDPRAGQATKGQGQLHRPLDHIQRSPAAWILEPRALDKSYSVPEVFSHKISCGTELYGLIFKPPNMDPSQKYPVVLSVYGGPEVQLVTNSFKVSKGLFDLTPIRES